MKPLLPQQVADGVRELPALPAVVMELIASLNNDALGSGQLADKISHDQAIAAKTLKLANSSFFGLSRQVTSIAEATSVLGLRAVRSIATAAGLAGAFPRKDLGGFDFDAFWRHSIGTALCAETLAEQLHSDPAEAFTVGLMHDIGRLVLATGFPVAYGAVLTYQQAQDCPVLDAERAVTGTDHCAVGALVAEHWRFAPSMVQALAQHHLPDDVANQPLIDLVHVADNMAHALDLGQQANDIVPPLSLNAWRRLGVSDDACLQVFRQAESRHEAVCLALLM